MSERKGKGRREGQARKSLQKKAQWHYLTKSSGMGSNVNVTPWKSVYLK